MAKHPLDAMYRELYEEEEVGLHPRQYKVAGSPPALLVRYRLPKRYLRT